MSALLSQTELHKLTGYARVTAQAGWLKDHGIPHRLVDGRRLLVSDTGRAVSEWMLSESRWNKAKQAAIKANPHLKDELAGLYLRDLRKRAADLADDMESASKLLQHSSMKLTADHYRTKPTKLKAVR